MDNNMLAYPIIGMSPGNSYFKDKEVEHLLKSTIKKYGRTAILVADVPAISTYLAMGYPENKARSKAMLKGNNLKNRTKRIAKELGYENIVKIIDWKEEIQDNVEYKKIFTYISKLYKDNENFTKIVDDTSREVLENSHKDLVDLDSAVKQAVHYLLSELAFMEFAPKFLETSQAIYVYHRNWPVYENYISGKFDNKQKEHLDFLLLENPYETYIPLKEDVLDLDLAGNTYSRILQKGVVRASYFEYPPAFIKRNQEGAYAGIFYEVIDTIAKNLGVELEWHEETGYGAITNGLEEGRFDIFCSTIWPTKERLHKAAFTDSLYDSPVGVWVSENNKYSSKSVEELKGSKNLRIAIKENDISDSVASSDFPDARLVRVPQLANVTEVLDFILEDKADITFVEPFLVQQYYDKRNISGGLKDINKEAPIRRYANTFMLRKGEVEFLQILNKNIAEMQEAGFIKELIIKYTGDSKTFLPPFNLQE